jgi:flagellar basal body P-ring protein FlgI
MKNQKIITIKACSCGGSCPTVEYDGSYITIRDDYNNVVIFNKKASEEEINNKLNQLQLTTEQINSVLEIIRQLLGS